MDATLLNLSFSAVAALALAMPAHHRAALKQELTPLRRWNLRGAGWLLVLAALHFARTGRGWSIGLVFWVASLAAAGFALTLLLAYRPRLVPVLAFVTLLLAALAAAGSVHR